MTRYDPPLEFEEPIDEMTPGQAHDAWEDATNLQLDGLQALDETPEHDAYLDAASEKRQTENPPIAGGPLDDAIHLAETPRSEWGPEERTEAEEAINWARRHGAQFEKNEGEDLTPGDGQKITKADVAGARWGFDWRLGDDWP